MTTFQIICITIAITLVVDLIVSAIIGAIVKAIVRKRAHQMAQVHWLEFLMYQGVPIERILLEEMPQELYIALTKTYQEKNGHPYNRQYWEEYYKDPKKMDPFAEYMEQK